MTTFKVKNLRTLPSPYRKKNEDLKSFETIYFLLVNMKDIPDDLPLDVNPREPKMTTNVAKALLSAVVEPENDFYINNRGIVISAKSLTFNSSASEVTLDLGEQNSDDRFLYGILDGGHTYKAIIEKRDLISNDMDKFVRIEVITNVQNITRLSDARNTSVQVSDIALFNLDDSFEYIKKSIRDENYYDKIAYKDNENKPINIAELLRLLYAFDIDKYSDNSAAPVQSYSGKAQVFKRYKEVYDTNLYKSLTKELPKLILLYETIEKEMSDKYCEYKKSLGTKNPKFGAVRGVESLKKKSKTHFLSFDNNYSISSGYIYPVLGAFRSLLKYNEEKECVYWLFNPLDIWSEIGTEIIQNTFETYTNPQLAGKDKQLWMSNYRIVENQSLRKTNDILRRSDFTLSYK